MHRLIGWLKKYGEPVVIVSGLPRSGTSMMMRMLEAGGLSVMCDGTRQADADNPKGYFELERVKHLEKETDKSYLREARGKVLKVISFLLKDLPEDNRYRVVFMRRDLDEVLASQRKMAERLGTADTLDEETLKETYRNDIVRARRWCRKRSNFELCEVSYKQAINEPVATAAEVNAFLGGGLDQAAMAAAVDPSLYRSRRESV
jgi:hypothetical protein